MLRYLGYVGQNLSLGVTSSRGTVLRNASPDRLRFLIQQNLRALAQILAFNAENQIRMYRISSSIIPFASHAINQLPWWDEFRGELSSLGSYVREQGMRVSMHPGQYSVLNSPDPAVVAAAVKDFQWHCQFLDSMELGPDHKVVFHAGGAYGDKDAATERLVRRCLDLPPAIRRRLVLENDDRLYTVEDVLGISERTGLPIVADLLHHQANPGSGMGTRQLLEECFATWRSRDGLPKVHFSSQAEGQRPGAHSRYVDPEEFLLFRHQAADLDFDCMLEAKGKDQALLKLREQMKERAGPSPAPI